jgi:hypothetical protein
MTGLFANLASNLAGAWAIMRGRADGLTRLDLSLEGFWRSFAAIVLLAPFAVLALISQQRLAAAAGEDPATGGLGLEAVALLVDWLAFPLVFAILARPLGVGARYVPFIVARNWASVIIAAMVALVHGAHILGLVPSQFAPVLLLVAVAVALRFSYVIARTTLGVPAAVAIPIVVLDLLISLTVWATLDRLV